MQACEVCGWDTRAGTRVCASCRAEQESSESTGDGVLAGVLQQARAMSADASDAGHPPDDQAGATTSRRPRGPRRDDHGREQVVLREIEPGGDEIEQPHRSEPSSVAASLLEAFQLPQETGSAGAEPSTAPDSLRAGTTGDDHSTDAGGDVALGPADFPTTVGPATSTADTDRFHAVTPSAVGADEDEAIEVRSRDADGATGPPPAGGQAGTAAPTRRWASSDDSGPITDRFANIPTVPMDAGPSPGLPTAVPTEASAARQGEMPDAAMTSAPLTADREDRPAEIGAGGTAAAPDPAEGRAPTGSPAGEQAPADTPAWRAALREAGTWTTVAQFTLLFIGMLCVFQVVVLLVVNQFLSQAQTQPAVAADMLAAHAKVATVMLPALIGGALSAAALAAWRAHEDPQERDDATLLRRWVLGLPVAIWAVIVAAAVLLLVVLLGTSTTVVEAQRMTLWAIGACTLLGVACVAAPRGLAVVEDTEPDAAEGSRTDAVRR